MADYWVDGTNGNNDNAGDAANPWKTINYAVHQDRPWTGGDTIWVKPGTYNTDGVNFGKGGTGVNNYITLKSETKHAAIINGTGVNGIWMKPGLAYIRVDGFEVKNCDAGIIAKECHHIDVLNNYVHDVAGNGIYLWFCDWKRVEGNYVTGCCNGSGFVANAYTDHFARWQNGSTNYDSHLDSNPAWRSITRGNVFVSNGKLHTGTDGGGIMIDCGYTANTANRPDTIFRGPRLVENNICWDNGGPGIIILEVPNTLVRGNTSHRNGRKSSAVDGWTASFVVRSDEVTVVNNIFTTDKSANDVCISVPVLSNRKTNPLSNDYTPTSFTYNDLQFHKNCTFNSVAGQYSLYQNKVNQVTHNDANMPTIANNPLLGTDPKYALASGHTNALDFKLKSDSPCIDAGTASYNGKPANDFGGFSRGTTMDLGAWAYVAPAVPVGSIADNSVVVATAVSRVAQTGMAAAMAITGFTQRAQQDTVPACWMGDTGAVVVDEFAAVPKETPAIHTGGITLVFSMKPAP